MIDITFKKLCECLRMPQGGCKARRLFEWNYSFFAQLFTSENGNIQCTGHVILCTCLFEHFYGISNPTTFSSVSMIFPHLQLIKVLRIWKKKKIRQIVGKKSFHCCFCVFVPFPFCCVPFFDAPANYAIHCWIQTARQPQKLPACCATAILRFIFISFFSMLLDDRAETTITR